MDLGKADELANRREGMKERKHLLEFIGICSRCCSLALLFAASSSPDLSAEPNESSFGQQENGYVDVSGSMVYYEECGSGPPIVFLHDGLLSSLSWDEVWQPLAAKYHVIRYDRRGYGRSDPATSRFSPTEDIAKLLAHLNVQHAVIVGSSSGAALAIDFAIEHPQMLDGLFLIGPVVHGLEYSAEFRERSNRNNEPMERGDVQTWAGNWSQDRFLIAGTNEEARRKIHDQLIANAEKLKNYDSNLEEKLSPPAGERLAQINAPTLILEGEGDIADVHAHCRAIKGGVRNAELVLVKGAGHLIQLERPDDVVKRLEDFAQRCTPK